MKRTAALTLIAVAARTPDDSNIVRGRGMTVAPLSQAEQARVRSRGAAKGTCEPALQWTVGTARCKRAYQVVRHGDAWKAVREGQVPREVRGDKK